MSDKKISYKKLKVYSVNVKKNKKQRKKNALKMLEHYKTNTGKQQENSIEKKVRLYLETIGIYFIPEYGIQHKFKKAKKTYYKVYDFYVVGNLNDLPFSFFIECDGTYYHSEDYYEGKKVYNELTYVQKKNVRNDKLKNKIAKDIGIPLLRLKEKDIKYNFDVIIEQIQNEIKRQTS